MVKKMFDTRKQNPNCGLAENVVSYIYEEMIDSERANFEEHLSDCSSCTDEIAAFSSISHSIQDWKDVEFANVSTPQIEIPYETKATATQTVETIDEKRSILDSIGGWLSLSPAFFKTATAFGAIALTIGLGWFVISSLSDGSSNVADVGDQESKEQKNELTPEKEEITPPLENEVVKKTLPTEENTVLNESKPKIAETNSRQKRIPAKKTIVNASHSKKAKVYKKRTVRKSKSTKKKKSVNPKTLVPTTDIQQLPVLADVEIEKLEDNDVRLSDIFDDSGSDD